MCNEFKLDPICKHKNTPRNKQIQSNYLKYLQCKFTDLF